MIHLSLLIFVYLPLDLSDLAIGLIVTVVGGLIVEKLKSYFR